MTKAGDDDDRSDERFFDVLWHVENSRPEPDTRPGWVERHLFASAVSEARAAELGMMELAWPEAVAVVASRLGLASAYLISVGLMRGHSWDEARHLAQDAHLSASLAAAWIAGRRFGHGSLSPSDIEEQLPGLVSQTLLLLEQHYTDAYGHPPGPSGTGWEDWPEMEDVRDPRDVL